MITAEQLFKYSVAGFSGEEVTELAARAEAIDQDRVFAVVTVNQLEQFLQDQSQIPLRATQVGLPEMVLCQTDTSSGALSLTWHDQQLETGLSVELAAQELPLATNLPTDTNLQTLLSDYTFPVRVSRRSQSKRWAVDCGDTVATWLSSNFGKPVRLVQAVQTSESVKHHFTWYTDLHLISRASVAALAEQTGLDIDIRRFRPNIVVNGAEPFAEENWLSARVKGQELEVSECERCGYVGVNPDTGEKATQMQILNTISQEHDLKFGIYLRVKQLLNLSVDDEFEVQ